MIPLGKSRKFVCFCYFVCLFDKTVDCLYSHSFYSTFCPITDEIFYCFGSVSRETIFPDFPEGYVLKSIGFMQYISISVRLAKRCHLPFIAKTLF